MGREMHTIRTLKDGRRAALSYSYRDMLIMITHAHDPSDAHHTLTRAREVMKPSQIGSGM
jgi:hypothetical protein